MRSLFWLKQETEQKSIPEWITPPVGVPAPTVTIPGSSPHGWVAPAGAGLPAPCDAQLDVVAVAPQMPRPAVGSSPGPAQSIALLSSSSNTVQSLPAPAATSTIQHCAKTLRRSRSVSAEDEQARTALAFWCDAVRSDLKTHSSLFHSLQGLAQSEQDTLITAAFHGEPSTLSRHIGVWKKWRAFCIVAGDHCGCPSHLCLFRFLTKKDLSSASAKASLLFAAARAECKAFATMLQQPVIKGLAKMSRPTSEVRNANPLPLAFLCFLESIVCNVLEPLGTRLVSGAVLAACWGSLRFSDFQRSSPGSLNCMGWILRGRVWKAKLRPRGFPLAFLGRGFTRAFPQRGWAHHWLDALAEWLQDLTHEARQGVSFLLPETSLDGKQVSFRKETRQGFVARLRKLLSRWSAQDPNCGAIQVHLEAWTAHSCKGTLLSWATAKDLPEHWLAQQGHHARLATRSTSVTTYGKSDVNFALSLQGRLLSEIVRGWRPLPAQGRGSQPPLPEPAPLGLAVEPDEKEFEHSFRDFSSWQPPLPEIWQLLTDRPQLLPCRRAAAFHRTQSRKNAAKSRPVVLLEEGEITLTTNKGEKPSQMTCAHRLSSVP